MHHKLQKERDDLGVGLHLLVIDRFVLKIIWNLVMCLLLDKNFNFSLVFDIFHELEKIKMYALLYIYIFSIFLFHAIYDAKDYKLLLLVRIVFTFIVFNLLIIIINFLDRKQFH